MGVNHWKNTNPRVHSDHIKTWQGLGEEEEEEEENKNMKQKNR